MPRWKPILTALLLTFQGKNVFAAGATAAVAGATAAQLGADPWPWIVGSGGAAVAFLLRTPATWQFALGHGAISVFAGGIGAPFAATILAHYIHPVWANDLLLAGVLSVGWPWLVPLLMERFKAFLGPSTQPTEKKP